MTKGCTPNTMQRRPKGGDKKVYKPKDMPKPKKAMYRPQGR